MAKISEIIVRNLFGRYNYKLQSMGNNIFLYGDNGSGKSTILLLTFHILCTERGGGHKSWVANCPFKSVVITLDNGTVISAIRDSGSVGTFKLTSNLKKAPSVEFQAAYDGTGYTLPGSGNLPNYYKFINELEKVCPAMVYITDSRTLLVSEPSSSIEGHVVDLDDDLIYIKKDFNAEPIIDINGWDRLRGRNKDSENQVLVSLRRVNSYFNKIVSQASIESDSNVNQIYLKILKDITSSNSNKLNKVDIYAQFGGLSVEMSEYVKYGLMPNLDIDLYLEMFNHAKGYSKTAVSKAIIPLLDALVQRMSALAGAKGIIAAFDKTINNVLLDKEMQYSYGQGIRINCGSHTIEPAKLSSGEKQLIIILCNIICKAQSSPIFFIDEPEISLNIKWQRDFVAMLEATTSHSTCQFLLATHSMEILAQNTNYVINLNEQRDV